MFYNCGRTVLIGSGVRSQTHTRTITAAAVVWMRLLIIPLRRASHYLQLTIILNKLAI